ncbi:CLUMA_CG009730, isoform A [Clunio marinus]|uniref:CLUMA_CG009730, isoform A n=1 Tax=Clunio marinus TaxID=568069 RepID=A0A1J1I7M6_9DIPT|nr:CLUMA_CG009730, isoform A [Clunio marinus]
MLKFCLSRECCELISQENLPDHAIFDETIFRYFVVSLLLLRIAGEACISMKIELKVNEKSSMISSSLDDQKCQKLKAGGNNPIYLGQSSLRCLSAALTERNLVHK